MPNILWVTIIHTLWYRLDYTVVQQGGWRVISWLSSCNKLYYMLSKRSMAVTKCTKQYLYTTYMYIYMFKENTWQRWRVHFVYAHEAASIQYNIYYHNVLLMLHRQNQLCARTQTHIPFFSICAFSSSTTINATLTFPILRFYYYYKHNNVMSKTLSRDKIAISTIP